MGLSIFFRFDFFVFFKISQLSTILLLCSQSKFSLSLEQLFKQKQLVIDRPLLGEAKLRIKTKLFVRIYTKMVRPFLNEKFILCVLSTSSFLLSLFPSLTFIFYGVRGRASSKETQMYLIRGRPFVVGGRRSLNQFSC